MVQILAAITAIVVMGVVNIGTVDVSNLGRDDSISLITAKFLQDTMPDMKNWRWSPGGHYSDCRPQYRENANGDYGHSP